MKIIKYKILQYQNTQITKYPRITRNTKYNIHNTKIPENANNTKIQKVPKY